MCGSIAHETSLMRGKFRSSVPCDDGLQPMEQKFDGAVWKTRANAANDQVLECLTGNWLVKLYCGCPCDSAGFRLDHQTARIPTSWHPRERTAVKYSEVVMTNVPPLVSKMLQRHFFGVRRCSQERKPRARQCHRKTAH